MGGFLMNCIVFSKDRACQLDAFLRSLKTHWKTWQEETKLSIMWTCSHNRYLAGYEILFKEHPEFNHVEQRNKDFKQILISLVDPNIPYTVQFVDDIIFTDDFTVNCPEFEAFKNEPETSCLSLRMHPGITYCYMQNFHMTPPAEAVANLKWEWLGLPGDFGYAMSQDGHIFRTEDLLPCFKYYDYGHPNALEGLMTYVVPKRPFMRCFQKAKIINIPSNRVGQNIHNRSGSIPSDFLNEQYLTGKRINLKPFDGLQANAVHYEMEYAWL